VSRLGFRQTRFCGLFLGTTGSIPLQEQDNPLMVDSSSQNVRTARTGLSSRSESRAHAREQRRQVESGDVPVTGEG